MIYIPLDRKSNLSLTKQIYIFLQESILNGTLKEGEKLPSTREFAKYINVSRNVIIESYEQLIAEGYAYSKPGSGTYISDGILFFKPKYKNLNKSYSDLKSKNSSSSKKICFRTGIPDLSSIPIKKWGQIYKEITLSLNPSQMDYQNPYGEYELRYQLALHLYLTRGVNTTPKNIIITNGAAQAFSLLCQFVNNNEYALVENPLSYGILHTLKSNNVNIKPIPLDNYGMITSKLPTIPPKLIFTTPSHQFPTGVIMPIKRRIELVKYAKKYNSYIVEDDYDSEFRFSGNPIQSMQYLDPSRVIYIGTFSKTFMPALRMGYMVLPDELCSQMKEAKFVADFHSPILEQLTLAKFIEEGLFDKHIKKMRNLYLKKRNTLIKSLKENFKDKVTISGADAGLHFITEFKGIKFDKQIMNKIANNNIIINAEKKHYLSKNQTTPYDSSLIFGYGNVDLNSIDYGVKTLYSILYSI